MRAKSIISKIKLWIGASIRRKLVVWSLTFWIISLTVLSLSILFVGQSVVINQTSQRNFQIASLMSREINTQVGGMVGDARLFIKWLQSASPDDVSQADALLSLKLASSKVYQSIYYFNSQGVLLLYLNEPVDTLLNMTPQQIAYRPSIVTQRTSEYKYVANIAGETRGINTVISDVMNSAFDSSPIMYLAIPFSLQKEKRVVVFAFNLDEIWQRINISTVGQSGFIYLVSSGGTILTHPVQTQIGAQIPPELTPLLDQYEGITNYKEPVFNREVLAAFSPVGGITEWGIVVVQDKDELYAPILRTELIVGVLWSLMGLLGIFGIVFLSNNVSRPILSLTRTTGKISETGELVQVPELKRIDEVGQLGGAFNKMIQRLRDSEGKLANAAIEERNRLARDLHDAVSQTLFSACLIAEVLPKIWERNPQEGRKRLEEIRQLTRGALAEMRTLLLELRPSALIDADMENLLKQLADSISGRSRIPISVNVHGKCNVPVDVKIALYRIAQEALNNIAKHSRATAASLTLACLSEEIILEIGDNGTGFDVLAKNHTSLGMGIINERAAEIHAQLNIESQPGSGTRIAVSWKLEPSKTSSQQL